MRRLRNWTGRLLRPETS